MKHADYSTYLDRPGMLDYIEREWLKNQDIHNRQARVVNEVIANQKSNTVIEIGCSTGNAAKLLCDNECEYTGIDANLASLMFALMKNPYKQFIHGDIRKFSTSRRDLVFTFAVLKHFSIIEWPTIFRIILSLGEWAIFDMPVAATNKDDGKEYHHVWLSKEYITEQVRDNDHHVVKIYYPDEIEPIFVTRKNA